MRRGSRALDPSGTSRATGRDRAASQRPLRTATYTVAPGTGKGKTDANGRRNMAQVREPSEYGCLLRNVSYQEVLTSLQLAPPLPPEAGARYREGLRGRGHRGSKQSLGRDRVKLGGCPWARFCFPSGWPCWPAACWSIR